MFRYVVVPAVCIALLSSAALADTVQLQGFDMGTTLNGVGVVGTGSVANSNVLTVNNSQLASDNVTHNSAFQGTTGALIQSAGAGGLDGLFTVGQAANPAGAQIQMPSLGIQTQSLDAGLFQNVFKEGGSGLALGLQTFVGVQMQLNFTPYGGSANVQGLGTTLYDATAGGPNSTLSVNGGANIGVGQTGVN